MPYDFLLPDLGEGITEGEVRKWLVRENDTVAEHQPVVEVETDKAIVEVPSPRAGRVMKISKAEGSVCRVGEPLMTLAAEGEAPAEAQEKSASPVRPKSVSVVGVLPEADEEEDEILAVPAVRSLAKELGVSLASVSGSGPGGSITIEDVRTAHEAPRSDADSYGPVRRVAFRGLRKTIARNLAASQRSAVFVTGMEEADVTELWDLRDREKEALRKRGVRLTFLPFFIKAVQHSLRDHPMLNASIDEARDEIVVKQYWNIGVAVDTDEGLMVPVIRNAERKTLLELATEIQDLGARARERKLRLDEMKGGTFTITNYGHFGGLFSTPVINAPEVAILGCGRISDKPWVTNGHVVVRKVLPLSLTFDHRVTDGVDASSFLMKVVRYLEDPGLLFIESA
ncbi:MAG: dihydrolipoamide acetyltransferase family protein [Thermodesulfovibrionales bacterium]